jgi:hypothetical protein
MALARKSVKQNFHPSAQPLMIMENFRQMTNDCIRIGLEFEKTNNRTPSMKKLSLLAYHDLRERYRGYSGYALCAISKAAGILSARRKSIKRGFHTKTPYLRKRVLVSCYGFKIKNGILSVNVDARKTESIPLNARTRAVLVDVTLEVNSVTSLRKDRSRFASRRILDIRNMHSQEP